MITKLTILGILMSCLVAIGCVSVQNMRGQLIVNTLTLAAIEEAQPGARIERAQTIETGAQYLASVVDDREVALRDAYTIIYSEIRWDRLDPNLRIYLQGLFKDIAVEVSTQANKDLIDGDKRINLQVALGYVIKTAQDYQKMEHRH